MYITCNSNTTTDVVQYFWIIKNEQSLYRKKKEYYLFHNINHETVKQLYYHALTEL